MLLIQSTSCLTQKLWSNNYDEPVQNFLVSRDGRYVVFLGEKYHYIFVDKSGLMKELLKWPSRGLLFINTKETSMKVDRDNNVTGHATIESFFNNLRGDQRVFLESLRFRKKNGVLALKIPLKGKRYLPRRDLAKFPPALNIKYVFKIEYTPSSKKTAVVAAITPVSIVADTIFLFGKIIIYPFLD